jgi:hypothetical protein
VRVFAQSASPAGQQTENNETVRSGRNNAIEVERPVRRGSRPFAPKGPELAEGLDPKPLNVRATGP